MQKAEEKRAYLRQWRADHPGYMERWEARNRQKRNAYMCRWRAANPGYSRRHRATNPEKARAKDRKNNIVRSLRVRIRSALKNLAKSARTLDLVGCSVEQLWAHLENQFAPGMTRSNYGLWHIDHKRPCASFDLSDIAQQKVCFHFTNLQPLWALDNARKGCKVFSK